MRLIKSTIFIIVNFLFSPNAYTQSPEAGIDWLREHYSTENVFIHFDKDVYVAGETIWFKAYILAADQPSPYSTAINVELLTDSGSVISSSILPVLEGAAVGSFEIKKDAAQKNYTVRAFTRRMMNFGASCFYEKSLQILNPSTLAGLSKQVPEYRVSFFPEGGNMVGAVPAVVAFKASDRYGEPVPVEGTVNDSKGNEVVAFSAVHDGMGQFIFLPQPGERYIAQYTINEQKATVSLPEVKVSGITMLLQDDGRRRSFIINREKLANEAMNPAYLLGVQNNQVRFKIALPNKTLLVRGEIPEKELSAGILQLTLFTADHQPLAERMLFINNDELFVQATLRIDTLGIGSREKNVFTFMLNDSLTGTFSAAVTAVNKELPAAGRENIISRMMLQNDIRGYIHNPLYYFSGANLAARSHLDLVMMTSGWRRFNWDQVINRKLPALSFKDDNYISFSGIAYKNNRNALLKNTMLYAFISTKDSSSELLMLPVDSLGKFSMAGMIFNDTATVVFQQENKNNNSIAIAPATASLRKQFAAVNYPFQKNIAPVFVSQAMQQQLAGQFAYLKDEKDPFVTLQGIQLAATKKPSATSLVQSRYETGAFATNASHVYDLITHPVKGNPYVNVFDYLRTNAVGVTVDGSLQVQIRATRSFSGPVYATLFLDGVQVTSDFIATIPFREIALVKVYSNGFVGAEGGGAGGAVAVFTRKGDDRLTTHRNALSSVKIEGFTPVKEFYAPDYATRPGGIKPDNRSTLYWNPYLYTSAGQKELKLSFYNADDAGPLKIIITGFSGDGKLLHLEQVLQ